MALPREVVHRDFRVLVDRMPTRAAVRGEIRDPEAPDVRGAVSGMTSPSVPKAPR